MTIVRFEVAEDRLTRAFQAAMEQLLQAIPGAAVVVKLTGQQATLQELDISVVQDGRFHLIAGMAHGDKDNFMVYYPAAGAVFSSLSVSDAVKGAIVHLFSCNCGENLGEDLVRDQHAQAFVGYDDFVTAPKKLSLSRHFVKETVAITLAIARGDNKTQVEQAAKNAFDAAYQQLQSDPASTAFDLAALQANHGALVGPWTNGKFGDF